MKYTRLPFNGRFKITYVYGDYNPKLNITSDKRHHGLDMVGINSTDVYATCKGKVIFAGWNNQGYGNLVMIAEFGTNRVHYYAHLKSVNVSYGQEVSYITKLGVMGATGNVTGPHLHYEIRDNGSVINPCDYTGVPNKLGEYNSNNYIREEVEFSPYIVQVTVDALNVRTGPGTNYPIASHKNHCIRDHGKYTIVEVKGNWGKLKSGAGWICLDYTKRV